ncbi:MAG: hypothetical protein ACL7BU_16300 [Candidatus Phlomobacter fragariae]
MITYGEMIIAQIAMLVNTAIRLKQSEMEELYSQMKDELKRMKVMSLDGYSGRIEFFLLDWYQAQELPFEWANKIAHTLNHD